ncbi:hypothetical protein B0H14DRAFT_2642689 [Mycena olivaceomarginata]|nr:hypothetical protein B0H14DRAFT_2642689 [Mycena olivaceomarginata]
MPCPTATEIRLDHITACLTPALTLLKELNDAFGPPIYPTNFKHHSNFNLKRNKKECAQLSENIHRILYAIINLHVRSQTAGSLSPATMSHIGTFMETLHKIYIYIEAQQDGNKIKHLLRNNEMQHLFKDCHTGLDRAMALFKITPTMFNDITDIKKAMKLMHEELLEVIQTLSDTSTDSEQSSSPKIFYGRESEVDQIMKMLSQQSPRIAIMGGGGMGKTSLAKVVLHHPDTSAKFEHRFFITMRGAERPGKVHWTHPFLLPLQPLSDEAAQKTFMDITDNVYAEEEINQILQFTDNMPLAVDLIAHLVDYKGLLNVLNRWDTERTSLISVGYNQKSNLDVSIGLSLLSPRITPGSRQLLSLLSILPDGLSEAQLVQSNFPISNILNCKATLQAIALVYTDGNKVRSLVPVREYIQKFLPPSQSLVQALKKHFYALLELYQKFNGDMLQPVINQITSNLGNLQEVLNQGLYANPQLLIAQAMTHFEQVNNPLLESKVYHLAGSYFLNSRLDPTQTLQFYYKALDLSRTCRDINQECAILISIAVLKHKAGDYSTAQVHLTEAQMLSTLSGNMYDEAQALWIGAVCSTCLGDFRQSMIQLYRGREILVNCGLAGGTIDLNIIMHQGEMHFMKSEYAQARSIHSKVVGMSSPDKNVFSYALSLLNIANIDITIGGPREEVYQI